MQENLKALPTEAREKFAQLAELLQQASLLARDISRIQPPLELKIPELRRPKAVPEDQAWFWSEPWQAGERQVNQELETGDYAVFDSVEDLLTDLHRQV